MYALGLGRVVIREFGKDFPIKCPQKNLWFKFVTGLISHFPSHVEWFQLDCSRSPLNII